jgi:hypothetical protein
MRIPNINAASTFAGVSNQAAKETSDSSKARAASGEASQKANATPTVEDVAESQQASDRDAQEKYDGPSSRIVPASATTSASEHLDREAPSVFDLPVEDDTPPPQLDTQA